MRLRTPGRKGSVMWAYGAVLSALPSWVKASGAARVQLRLSTMVLVAEKRERAVAEVLNQVGHPASHESFRPLAPTYWMLAYDLYALQTGPALFAWSLDSARVVRALPGHAAVAVGPYRQGRLVLLDSGPVHRYRSVGPRTVAELVGQIGMPASTFLDELGLPNRVINGLWRGGFETVGALLRVSDRDLLDIRSFGEGCLKELRERLTELKKEGM